MKKNNRVRQKTVLLKDLMKTIFVFGQGGGPIQFITDLEAALCKLERGENFYIYPGGETLYHVNQSFYQVSGIPRAQVRQKLATLFPAPPEAVGL